MSNSKLIQTWFETARRPIGFSFQSFKTMLDGLQCIDRLHENGIFRTEAIAKMKLSYLQRFV